MNLGSRKLLYVAVGNVRAGVDLRKLDKSAVKFVDGKLELKPMPPAKILDIKLNLKRSYVYDIQKRLCLLHMRDHALEEIAMSQGKTCDDLAEDSILRYTLLHLA